MIKIEITIDNENVTVKNDVQEQKSDGVKQMTFDEVVASIPDVPVVEEKPKKKLPVNKGGYKQKRKICPICLKSYGGSGFKFHYEKCKREKGIVRHDEKPVVSVFTGKGGGDVKVEPGFSVRGD